MSASDDVQINVSDLLAAFAQENASLAQRAVLAEQKAKSLGAALDRAQGEIAHLTMPVTEVHAEEAPAPAPARKRATRKQSS